MSLKNKGPALFMAPFYRVIIGSIIIASALFILGIAALSVFETRGPAADQEQVQTSSAALSTDIEPMSKTVGRTFGILAATLLFFQFGMSSKPKTLDRVFGLHRLLYSHRVLGVSLVILASFHPLFMFALPSEEIGPLRLAIWPKLLGVILLISLLTGVCVALWRKFLSIPYQKWYLMHRIAMFSAIVILTFHVWNVSGDFHHAPLLYGLGTALVLYVSLFIWAVLLKPLLLKARPYTVTRVDRPGKDVHRVELTPDKGRKLFDYAPGQFAFVTFFSKALPVERHHWTISSTPTRMQSCDFTIKCSGDFTALTGRLKVGEKASVDGPYGFFSHLAHHMGPDREIIMVAGGIGVTPMLSMLRYMADTNDDRKIALIWSNRTENHILYREEMHKMKERLPRLTVHHVMSRQDSFQGPTGRLTREMLQGFLTEFSREAGVFVCGPPAMMNAAIKNIKILGFRRSRIYKEKFYY